MEWVRRQVETGRARRIALVARTAADGRDVMVEGQSGFLNVCPPWNRPLYEPSKRRLTWPCGAVATIYTGEEPDKLRGPEHDCAWADEICAWSSPEAWDNLLMGLRLGADPRAIVTTTPRPIKMLRDLLANPETLLTRGKTLDNAENLAPKILKRILAQYQGTRLGRQELEGEILEDVEGAYWTYNQLDELRILDKILPDGTRVTAEEQLPEIIRTVVGVDPAITSKGRNRNADIIGIVVVGLGADGQAYVLADYSLSGTPGEWAREVVQAWATWSCDAIVAETNRGGELIAHTIMTACADLAVKPRILDINSQEGKDDRAEPYVGMYEQKQVHHLRIHPKLEDEMCNWVPGKGWSPNRVDALVFALAELCPFRRQPPPMSARSEPKPGHYAPEKRSKRW